MIKKVITLNCVTHQFKCRWIIPITFEFKFDNNWENWATTPF